MHIRSKLILAFFYLVGLVILTAASAGFGLNQVYSSFGDLFRGSERWIAEIQREVANTPDVEVKQVLVDKLAEHDQALKSFRDAERRLVLSNSVQLGFLVTIGLLTLTFISVSLQRDVLSRLFKLKTFCEALLRGNRHLRISMTGNDELTLLGRLLNSALDRQDELQAELKGKLTLQKDMVLALLSAYERESLLLDGKGDILVSMLPEEIEVLIYKHHDAIKAWLAAQREPRLDASLTYEQPQFSLRLKPISAREGEIAGYIVSLRPD